MAGPFEAAGAVRDPTKYSALTMQGEQFTGLWTQRSPYRDAATAYLVKKFYQGSRFDSILDGINREIFADLTDGRRPGNAVYNNLTPAAAVSSFFSWKYIQNNAEIVRVLADYADGYVRDVTAGQISTLMAKTGATAPARFMNLNTELFIGDGLDQKKILTGPVTWTALTAVTPGTLITEGAAPGTLQMALGGLSLPIVATSSNGVVVTVYIDPQQIPNQFANLQGVSVTFAGLTGTGVYLNGNTYAATIISSTLGILTVPVVHAAYVQAADTGTGSTGNGTTGAGAPAWSGAQFGVTADAGQQWKCYGTALENWGLATPLKAPVLTPLNGTRFWQPNTVKAQFFSVLDPNQNLQVMMNFIAGGTNYKTGRSYPQWTARTTTNAYALTIDGTAVWWNFGVVGVWAATTAFGNPSVAGQVLAILDSNQNLQIVTNGTGGLSGGSAPVWATAVGATTADGALTWTCVGPGVVLITASISYAYSTHAVDGSVSTASPATTIQGGILGPVAASAPYIQIVGGFAPDTQLDQIWIWRTPQGQSVLIQEDQIPVDPWYGGASFTYNEEGIPDTSSSGQGALNAFILAPVAHANDAPPVGLTGPVYHLQRTWGFVRNILYYSNGPDAVTSTSNGQTGWPPLNAITYRGAIVRLVPITVQNGGILVFTTSGVFIVLGTGTASNPFYTTQYCQKVNLANYNALDVLGTVIYLVESNMKVSSLTVEYPFNPQSGYAEVGLPIGNQFKKVTTGGLSAALFTAATTYLSWNIQSSGNTAMYVAALGGYWFRMSSISPPESGLLWSPIAQIVYTASAIQSVETAPGVFNLLIGEPAGGGPILMRDTTGTVWADNGAPYASWDAKGVILLCSTGQEADITWLSTKSLAVGSRPVLGLLMGEIANTAQTPWDVLQPTGPDPANLKASLTAFCDRYNALQNGNTPRGDCALIKFDYGTQAVGDKLLEFGIFGSTTEERKQ